MNYRNKKYEEKRKINGINVSCEEIKDSYYTINEEIIEYKGRIEKDGIMKFLEDEEIDEEIKTNILI